MKKRKGSTKTCKKECKGFKDKVVIVFKTSCYLLIPFLIVLIVMFFLPENIRPDAGWKIIKGVVFTGLINLILPYVAKTKKIAALPLVLVLVGITIPCIVGIAHPHLYDELLGKGKIEQEEVIKDIKYDYDLVNEIEEKVAIETVANDIDDGLFKQFYELSYVENGIVKLKPDASEDTKIQLIMDAIVYDIERLMQNEQEYTYDELNAGRYGELTNAANREEQEY